MQLAMTLHQRENGTYYVVYRDHDKKQIWKSLKTKDAAMAKRLYNQFKKAYLEGKIARIAECSTAITLVDYKSQYLNYVETTKRDWTYRTTYHVLNKFIRFVGEKNMVRDIKSKTIDDYVVHCRRLGNSAETINKDLRTLQGVFTKAKEYGYLKENPITSKKKLRLDKRPPKHITPNEFKILMGVVDDRVFSCFIYFITYTGCRRQEALNITWKNINRVDGYIEITQAKSHEYRRIPISEKLSIILDTIDGNVGKLFPYTYDRVGRLFKEYSEKAGVSCTLHSLRHTFATILANSETPLKVLQELMGHKAIQSTMIYATALDEKKHSAVNKIDL